MITLAQHSPAHPPADRLSLDSLNRTRNKFVVIGTLSVGLPTDALMQIAGSAIYVSSGIEYRPSNYLTLVGMSEIWTATVRLPPSADQPFAIRGRSNNIFVSLNAGYYQSKGRWTGYGIMGAGAGLVSRPNVDRLDFGSYNVMAQSAIEPIWRIGAGIEYRISNTLVPYVEGAYASTFNATLLGERKLTYVSIGVGIKAYLKVRGILDRN